MRHQPPFRRLDVFHAGHRPDFKTCSTVTPWKVFKTPDGFDYVIADASRYFVNALWNNRINAVVH